MYEKAFYPFIYWMLFLALLSWPYVYSFLIGNADSLHIVLDDYNSADHNISMYNIVGCGNGTLGKVSNMYKDIYDVEHADLRYINGDGTVPLKSALGVDGAIQTYYVTGESHAFLPSANGVMDVVTHILNFSDTSQFPFQNFSNISTSDSICTFSGYTVSLYSPITLNAYDQAGNHVGYNKDNRLEVNIEGASYDEVGSDKFIFLPIGSSYTIKGAATGIGNFDMKVTEIRNGEIISEIYYNDVPLSKNTSMRMEITKHPEKKIHINSGKKEIEISPNKMITK